MIDVPHSGFTCQEADDLCDDTTAVIVQLIEKISAVIALCSTYPASTTGLLTAKSVLDALQIRTES